MRESPGSTSLTSLIHVPHPSLSQGTDSRETAQQSNLLGHPTCSAAKGFGSFSQIVNFPLYVFLVKSQPRGSTGPKQGSPSISKRAVYAHRTHFVCSKLTLRRRHVSCLLGVRAHGFARQTPPAHHQSSSWPTQNKDSRRVNSLRVLTQTRAAMELSSPFRGTQEHNPLTEQTESWSRRLRKARKENEEGILLGVSASSQNQCRVLH